MKKVFHLNDCLLYIGSIFFKIYYFIKKSALYTQQHQRFIGHSCAMNSSAEFHAGTNCSPCIKNIYIYFTLWWRRENEDEKSLYKRTHTQRNILKGFSPVICVLFVFFKFIISSRCMQQREKNRNRLVTWAVDRMRRQQQQHETSSI